jgi:hypothetical protein
MKKSIYAVGLVLLLAILACSFQNVNLNIETGETRVVNIEESLPENGDETELKFSMAGGEFTINPGSGFLAQGTIAYNVEQWEPEFTRRQYYYEIKQLNPFSISGIPSNDIENTWDLTIAQDLPLDLTIEGGASKNIFNFTGLQLTNLSITQGASDTTLSFDAPNPVLMDTFKFTTGASSAKLYGLGYANFNEMNFQAGAGDYTLDFTGNLTHDSILNIKASISNITIIIPADMKAVINNNGTVSNINTDGVWLLDDDTYATLTEGFGVTINLDMAVGNVNLIHED